MVRSSGSHLGREKNINKNWGCGKKMESLERDLHCPVCLDVYTKPVLMLPCQHNLCRQCVQNIVYTQDEDDEGYRGGPGRPSAFPCPQCRQCTYLGRRGIDGLKRNILVENIVDSYREVAAQIKKKVVCAEHEDERPSLYCSSHEKAICALCKLVGEHKECEVQELKNVLADKKGMLQGKVQLLEDRSHQLDRFIQENKTLSKSVEDKCSQHKDMVRRETLALFSIISKRQSTLYDKLEVEKEEKLASLSGQVARCEEEKGRVAGLVRDAEVLMKEEEPTRFVEAANEMAERLTLGAESEELTPCVDEEFEHCLVDFKEAQDMLKKLDFVEGASGRTSPDRQPCPGPNCSAYGDSVYNNLCSKCYRVLTAANSGAQTDQDGKKNSQTQESSGQPSSAAQQSSSQTCPTSPDRQSQWSYNSQSPGGSPARGRGRRNSGGRGPSLYYCNCPQCAEPEPSAAATVTPGRCSRANAAAAASRGRNDEVLQPQSGEEESRDFPVVSAAKLLRLSLVEENLYPGDWRVRRRDLQDQLGGIPNIVEVVAVDRKETAPRHGGTCNDVVWTIVVRWCGRHPRRLVLHRFPGLESNVSLMLADL
ncbi:tripartite motif-containing protein 54-like isoform X3 [Branchiostoma floridae x Branchiostoma belcheri]